MVGVVRKTLVFSENMKMLVDCTELVVVEVEVEVEEEEEA